MIGVALSGGGTKGAFQAGVIYKLLDQPDLVIGTSIGAVNSCVWNYCGKDYLRDQWFSTKKRSQWLNLNWRTAFWNGLYSPEPLLEKISEIHRTRSPSFLSAAVRVHIKTGKLHYVPNTLETYPEAVIDSSTVPVAMRPLGEYLDGGLREKTPVVELCRHGCKKIIVICNNPFQEDPDQVDFPSGIIEMAVRTSDIITHEMAIDDLDAVCSKGVELEFYAPENHLYDTFCFDNDKLIDAFKMGEKAQKLSYEEVLRKIRRR